MKKENKQMAREMRAKKKQQKKVGKIVGIVAAVIVGLALIGAFLYFLNKADTSASTSTTTNGTATSSVSFADFSKYLNADGTIKDVNISDYVTVGDISGVDSITEEQITPSEEEIMAKVEENLSGYATLNENTGVTVATGDKIRLDYTGYIDGVAFENGSTEGNGTDLTLGSGSYIDTFEEQLAGNKVGDHVTVTVTFPDPYENNTDLSGKEAVFECDILGVYALDLTDELIAEKVDGYETVDAYKAYVEGLLREDNLTYAIYNVLNENVTISDCPEDYINNLVTMEAYSLQVRYENYAAMYESYLGTNPWSSIESFYGMTTDQLNSQVAALASSDAAQALVYQAVYESEGLSITDADKETYCRNMGYTGDDISEMTSTYGEGFIAQGAIGVCVMNYLMERVENANK